VRLHEGTLHGYRLTLPAEVVIRVVAVSDGSARPPTPDRAAGLCGPRPAAAPIRPAAAWAHRSGSYHRNLQVLKGKSRAELPRMRRARHRAPAARGRASAPLAAGARRGLPPPEYRTGPTGTRDARSVSNLYHRGRRPHAQAIGGTIQTSAVFGDDHYVPRGAVTEAA
jgi:hypothetical protein